MSPLELCYFTLPAPSLDKSKSFYSKVLGFEIGGGSMGGHVNNTNTPTGFAPSNTVVTDTSVMFSTFDLEKTTKGVVENGGTVLNQSEGGVGKSASCKDNQGTLFTVIQPSKGGPLDGLEPVKGTKNGDIFFFSIPVMDEVKAQAFFAAVNGWEFGEKGGGGGMAMTNLQGPDGGLGCGREGHHPSIWFRIDDIKKTVVLVKEAGGTAGEIFDAPEGTMSECVDDQGVTFGLAQPAPGY